MIRRTLRHLRPHLIVVSMLLGGMAASPLWQVTG